MSSIRQGQIKTRAPYRVSRLGAAPGRRTRKAQSDLGRGRVGRRRRRELHPERVRVRVATCVMCTFHTGIPRVTVSPKRMWLCGHTRAPCRVGAVRWSQDLQTHFYGYGFTENHRGLSTVCHYPRLVGSHCARASRQAAGPYLHTGAAAATGRRAASGAASRALACPRTQSRSWRASARPTTSV